MLGDLYINDVRAQGRERVVKKWTTVLISCAIMYVTRREGVQKSEIFADVIEGSPLMLRGPIAKKHLFLVFASLGAKGAASTLGGCPLSDILH